MRKRPWLAAGLAAAAAVAVVTVPAQAAPPAPLGTGVTLLTGDHVTIEGERARVRPGQGREHMRFRQYTDERGDLHVVPTDVQPLLSAKKLDPRLFDVTELVRQGYDDAHSKVTPLIVQGGGVSALSGRALPSIGGKAVQAEKGTSFWSGVRAAETERIWLDGRVTASLDKSVPQIGAPKAWESGHTGKDTTVAVLDTGVDATHPDLAGAVAEAKDFSQSATGADDRFGHGTHVAATITGDGQDQNGRYKGVAPDTKLFNGKVLNDNGSGAESWIIAGMEWAAAKADVINMSLGSPWPSDGSDPMSQAVNRLTRDHGVLFVVSAGNSGPSDESIGSPAAADLAVTVGAVDRDDQLAPFSSRGPRWIDGAIKPDITAPGVGVVAAKAAHGVIGDPVGDKHVALSGTSMAAPHVAGAAAVLAGQHPDWTAQQLKDALMSSAKPNPALTVYQQGAGRVDVAQAVTQQVSASPASLSLGTALWPHADDKPIVKTVTYRNTGTAPVTLDVTGSLSDPAGKPAVAGMFAVSPSKVVVPAGGEAPVTVTVTTSLDSPDGTYTGTLSASGGGTAVRVPVAVTKEVESYEVKLSFVNRAGAPTDRYFYRFVSHDRPKAYVQHDPDGSITQRLPKGKYYYESYVQETDWRQMTEIVEPAFTVTGDTTLVNDAKDGVAPGFTVDKPNAKVGDSMVQFAMTMSWGPTGHTIIGGTLEGFLVKPSKTSAPDAFTYTQQVTLAEPDGKGGFAGSPYVYHLSHSNPGSVPADLHPKVSDKSLAVVSTTVASRGSNRNVRRDNTATGPAPLRLTEYYTPDVPFYSSLQEYDGDPAQWDLTLGQSTFEPRSFKRGKATDRWNAAVFGPAFPHNERRPGEFAYRRGDELRISVPLFTDQDSRRTGWSRGEGKTVLSRNGSVVHELPYSGSMYGKVPADKSRYQLHTEADHSQYSELSTKITADWTFESGTVPGEDPAAIPLLAVRFAPSLDDHNRAAAGRGFAFPVYVQQNGTASAGVRTPAVQVSYDDGKTWKPVHVIKFGDRWLAAVVHPKDAKFVSLKAQAKNSAGNTVDQTIIRAYGLK